MEPLRSACNAAQEALAMFLDDLAPLKTEARGKVRSLGFYRVWVFSKTFPTLPWSPPQNS